jgi:hypothetical protein
LLPKKQNPKILFISNNNHLALVPKNGILLRNKLVAMN